jgi:hypothetical protein
MTLLIWAFRILILLLIIRFLVRLFLQRPARPVTGRSRGPERLGGTLVRDPHCGTYVPQTTAITVGRGTSARHFCSTRCRDAWAEAHRT